MRIPSRLVRRAALAVGLTLAVPATASATLTGVEGESFNSPSSGVAVVASYPSDQNVAGALNNSAMRFKLGGTITKPTSVPVSELRVLAKATGASGATLNVALKATPSTPPSEAVDLGTLAVAPGDWRVLSFPLPAGTRADTVSKTLALTYNGVTGGNLYVDKVLLEDVRPRVAFSAPSTSVTIQLTKSGVSTDPAKTTAPASSFTYTSAGTNPDGTKFIAQLALKSTTTDYKLALPQGTAPDAIRDSLRIIGGRNISIVGGQVNSTGGTALYFESTNSANPDTDVVRTIHIEGVLIDNASRTNDKKFSDGIFVDSPKATVQVVNTRILNIMGRELPQEHGDAIQTLRAKNLLVDRLTVTTNYQGLFIRPDQSAIDTIDLRHVDISVGVIHCPAPAYTGQPEAEWPDLCAKGGDAIYFDNTSTQTSPSNQRIASLVKFSDTFVTTSRTDDPGLVSPWTNYGTTRYQATLSSSGIIYYPNAAILNNPAAPAKPDVIQGWINQRTPAYAYVKDNEAGLGYTPDP